MTLHELGLMVEENIGVSKMTEKFYKLTNSDWLKVCLMLSKASDIKVWGYLVSNNPFADKAVEYEISEIAQALKLGKSTVYKSLKTLNGKGFIDFEPTRIRVTVKSVSKQEMDSPNRELILQNENSVSKRKTDSPNREDETVKPLSDNGSGVPQTLQTNKDLKTHTDHPPARSVCVNIDDEDVEAYIKEVVEYQESGYSQTWAERYRAEEERLERESLTCSTNPVEDKSSEGVDVLVYKPQIEKLGVRFEAVVKQLRENSENIPMAIASLQEAKDSNQCKNPTGYLKKALIEGWMPEKQQYLVPLNATTKSPSQMSDEEWMVYLANTLTRERRNQLIRFTIPGALGERIAVLANGVQIAFAQAKQMTIQQFEQMAFA
jgi:predicted transcriptional regulator